MSIKVLILMGMQGLMLVMMQVEVCFAWPELRRCRRREFSMLYWLLEQLRSPVGGAVPELLPDRLLSSTLLSINHQYVLYILYTPSGLILCWFQCLIEVYLSFSFGNYYVDIYLWIHKIKIIYHCLPGRE
nr:hypothetical protein Iba_chr14eCG7180 [Ipomoea batatas]